VKVGGSTCAVTGTVTATSLTCTTGARAVGVVDVVVTNPDTGTRTKSNAFEYLDTPTVTSVSPASGTVLGGTSITITGTNFSTANTVTVTVGGTACPITGTVTATSITCTTPVGTSGAADVVVTNPDSQEATKTDGYKYLPLRRAQAIGAGYAHVCALLTNGSVKCWGYNNYGQLGLGDTNIRGDGANEMADNLPAVDLGTDRTATAIAVGSFHSCALLDDDSVKCWGNNTYGQLGQGDVTDRGDGSGELGDNLVAVDLGAGRTAQAISAGDYHTCALLDDDTVKCWGRNSNGQLGLGDTANRGDDASEMGAYLPVVDLGTDRTAAAIAAGDDVSCALLDDDNVKCWGLSSLGATGQGGSGNLGDASDELGDNLAAISLGTGRTAKALTSGGSSVCAVLDDNSLKCWGYNAAGQLGLGDTSNRGALADQMGNNLPVVDLGTGRTTTKVVAGNNRHTCALLDDASLKCWGGNTKGQLGLGDKLDRGDGANEMGDSLSPLSLGTGRTAIALALGFEFTCAVLDNGLVKCWGASFAGALGLGDASDRGDGSGEMGDNLPIVNLGTGADEPTVSSVSPSYGPIAGGTSLTITGSTFATSGGLTVTVGGDACAITGTVTATSITCTTAAHAVGAVDVKVTNPDGEVGTKKDGFEYLDKPTVTSVSPSSGPTAGGTSITVGGTNFATANTVTVTVGGNACTITGTVTATSLTCSTAAHAAGAVDVVLTNPDSESDTETDGFTFVAPPSISSVSPTSGSTLGGTSVTITGTSFATSGTVSVTVGGNACAITGTVTATSITCTTAAHAAGDVDVVVTNPDTQSDTETDGFEFVVAPSISSVSPNVGGTAGGTSITISGGDFATSGTVSVMVGGNACAITGTVTATSITCTTAAHAAGATDVVVTNPDGQSDTETSGFRFVANPDVTAVGRVSLPLAGGTLLTITGTGFDTEPGAVVAKIGGVDCVTVAQVSATELGCTVPASLTTGLRDVTVENTAITQSDTLANGVRYDDGLSWIATRFPSPSVTGLILKRDVNDIIDNAGDCNRDLSKLLKDMRWFVRIGVLSASDAADLTALVAGLCTQQINPPSPAEPVAANRVSTLDVAPECSASFSTPSVSLDVFSSTVPVIAHSFTRSGFDYAAFWVRVGEGAWSPAVGLTPPNGSATAVPWSSDFLQLVLFLAGVTSLSEDRAYGLEFAYGSGGSFDAYDADAVACTTTLSIYVGQLPVTGSESSNVLRTAMWVSLAGVALVLVGSRRRRRAAATH